MIVHTVKKMEPFVIALIVYVLDVVLVLLILPKELVVEQALAVIFIVMHFQKNILITPKLLFMLDQKLTTSVAWAE